MAPQWRPGVSARTAPLWAKAALLVVADLVAIEVGHGLSVQHVFASFWPAAGVLVAFLLVSEYREWPQLLALAALVNLGTDLAYGHAAIIGVAFSVVNCTESAVGATLVRRFAGPHPRMVTLREVAALTAFGVVLGPAVGASLGTSVVAVTTGTSDWVRTWATWWSGDAVGVVVAAPLLLVGESYLVRFWAATLGGRRRALGEVSWATLASVPVAAASRMLLTVDRAGPNWRFLILPAMLFIGVWLGPAGAAIATAVVGTAGVWAIASTAPAAAAATPDVVLRVLEVEMFLAVAGVTTLALAASAEDGRRAERDARANAEKYRVLLDRFPVGVTVTDANGDVIETSARGADILGVDDEEQRRRGIGGSAWVAVRADGSPMPPAEFPAVRALVEGTAVDNVQMGIVGSGHTTWINVSAAPVPVDGYGVTAVYEDITAGVEARERIRRSEERFRQLVDSIGDVVVCADGQGRIVEFNPEAERVFGRRREDVIGTDILESVAAPESRPSFAAAIVEALGGTAVLGVESRTTGDGQGRDILWSLRALEQPEGDAGIIAAGRDITDRKIAEENLRAASRYARSLIEASLDPFVTISPDGKITDVNAATEMATGISRPELIGTDFSDYFTEPEKARAGYGGAFSRGHVIDYPLAIRHVSGRVTDVLYNATTYRDESDEVVGVFAAARDVTERNRAEGELRRLKDSLEEQVADRTRDLEETNAQLLEASRAKSRFLANMSHELRTPLNSVIGFSGVLLSEMAGPLNEEQRKQTAMIRSAGEHLLSLVGDILDLTRIEAGKEELRASEFLVADLLESLSDVEKPAAEAKGLEFSTETPAAPIRMCTDRGKLEQILTNLSTNAVKFTESGRVTVSCARVRDQVVFRVSDTGVGIPADEIPRIMEDFHQVDRPRDGMKPAGTGLGLAISKRLAGLLGGRLAVTSELGVGSEFTLTVPVRR